MKLEIDAPESALSALRKAPEERSACLWLMAAAKLYEIGHLSQERAAELAGRSRHDFLVSLSSLGVGGMSNAGILAEFPELTPEDIQTALAFAADRDHHLVAFSA
jgi:hypothetical protein